MSLSYQLLLSTIDNTEVCGLLSSTHHSDQIFLILVSVYAYLSLCLPGKLDKGAVLKALCAGFRETTEPAVCLTEG